MRKLLLIITSALIFIAGCKTPVAVIDYKQNAEIAEEAGDYVIATQAWKAYFEENLTNENIDGSVYARAAQTANEAADTKQALEWFELARYKGYESPSIILTMAQIFRHQNNLSKELTLLEEYREKKEQENPDVNARLFSVYTSLNMNDKAMEIWNDVPDSQKGIEENLDWYFERVKKKGNESTADSVSIELLKINPEHIAANEWQAQKYYQIGEARYKQEMKKYEARPTSGNYQNLLRGLKAASENLRISLQHFEKLWEVNPDARKEYAVYMNNIHVRFNEKEKADFYRKYAN